MDFEEIMSMAGPEAKAAAINLAALFAPQNVANEALIGYRVYENALKPVGSAHNAITGSVGLPRYAPMPTSEQDRTIQGIMESLNMREALNRLMLLDDVQMRVKSLAGL